MSQNHTYLSEWEDKGLPKNKTSKIVKNCLSFDSLSSSNNLVTVYACIYIHVHCIIYIHRNVYTTTGQNYLVRLFVIRYNSLRVVNTPSRSSLAQRLRAKQAAAAVLIVLSCSELIKRQLHDRSRIFKLFLKSCDEM